jgi:hypothetical protein
MSDRCLTQSRRYRCADRHHARRASLRELFYTALPQGAFTPADVVALYLHRGAFETVLSDKDQEQDPDR